MSRFILIDVFAGKYKIPKKIKHTPAIIIKTPRMEPEVLVGDQVFRWYNQLLGRLQAAAKAKKKPGTTLGNGPNCTSQGISDYDPCTMAGFSDNFAFLDNEVSLTDPIEHQFSFIGREGAPNAMPPSQNLPLDNRSQVSSNNNSNEKKSELEYAFEQLQAQRNMDVPGPPQRKGGEAF